MFEVLEPIVDFLLTMFSYIVLGLLIYFFVGWMIEIIVLVVDFHELRKNKDRHHDNDD